MANNEWRPIDTAPKDGTRIMIGNAHETWIAEYRSHCQSGFKREDPWFSVMLNHGNVPREVRHKPPTHWMPLPEPPRSDQ